MAIVLDVYKKRRVAPLRFERAATGDPLIDRPEVDDRGYTGTEHGPVVGITAGDKVIVRLVRQRIDKNAPLFAISTAPAVASVGAAQLPATDQVELEITGVAGGNPSTATIEIRHGSATGPLLHRLTAWVFTALPISVTPHDVSVAGAGGAAAIASGVNIGAVKDLVRAIWRPCGVDISFQATVTDAVTHAAAGRAAWHAEVASLILNCNKPNTINAYFVNCLVSPGPGSGGVLGWGISKAAAPGLGVAGSAVLIGSQNVNGTNRTADSMWLANDLAHEIGHFFGLDHPEKLDPPNERKDLWSRRLLMHNYNTAPALGGWLDELGYGKVGADPRRGCMITMKNLTQLTTDGECGTSRSTISTPPGPY